MSLLDEMWIRIESHNFCVRADVIDGKICRPAPLIHWMRGWELERVREYCRKKRWYLREYA